MHDLTLDRTAVAPGEMIRHPELRSAAPAWTTVKDELTFTRGATQFLTLGHLSPVRRAQGAYRVGLQARWPRVPSDRPARSSLALGHGDDAYDEPGNARGNGYEAFLRVDGSLGLRAHDDGSPTGLVPADATSPALVDGNWVSVRPSVTPSTSTWEGPDVDDSAVAARDVRTRGPYLHLGRQSPPPSQVCSRALSVR